MKRRFNGKERIGLLVAASNKCRICGVELTRSFHADHIHPFSRGGATELDNGQALCALCNLKKGDSHMKLRTWQNRAIEAVLNVWRKQSDCLVVATPGAGKTVFALTIAKRMLDERKIGRVCVVCPTRSLRRQWERKASEFQLPLRGKLGNEHLAQGLPEDCVGWVATYQQVASNWEIHRPLAASRSTLVILDEIHHGGDDMEWGKSLIEAFDGAAYTLGISGTPFRSDDSKIPFVRYQDGRSAADYSYGYADAIRDAVCRQVVFPSFEGDMRWMSNGALREATFATKLSDDESRRRLNTAIDATGEFVKDVLRSANEKLVEIRNESQADAGGLVFARDQMHAQMLAGTLEAVSGRRPALIVSDDPEASAILDAFREGDSAWAVAVRMVAEGVDIPRLRVGVYLTNVSEELFIRQAVGRFVRVQGGIDDETAYVYFPRHEAFIDVIKDIMEERDHILSEVTEQEGTGSGGSGDGSEFVPLSSKATESDHISNSAIYAVDEIRLAREFKASIPELKGASEIGLVKLLRAHMFTAPQKHEQPKVEQTYDEISAQRSKDVQKLVNRLAWKLHPERMRSQDLASEVCKRINFAANAQLGIGPRSRQTVSQIEAKQQLIGQWLMDAENGRRAIGL